MRPIRIFPKQYRRQRGQIQVIFLVSGATLNCTGPARTDTFCFGRFSFKTRKHGATSNKDTPRGPRPLGLQEPQEECTVPFLGRARFLVLGVQRRSFFFGWSPVPFFPLRHKMHSDSSQTSPMAVGVQVEPPTLCAFLELAPPKTFFCLRLSFQFPLKKKKKKKKKNATGHGPRNGGPARASPLG